MIRISVILAKSGKLYSEVKKTYTSLLVPDLKERKNVFTVTYFFEYKYK